MDSETEAAADVVPQCEHCLYFQAEQWDTGYCRLHRMYVVKTFDCARFLQQPQITSEKDEQDNSSSMKRQEEQPYPVVQEVVQ